MSLDQLDGDQQKTTSSQIELRCLRVAHNGSELWEKFQRYVAMGIHSIHPICKWKHHTGTSLVLPHTRNRI
jgi:hypothetical protein